MLIDKQEFELLRVRAECIRERLHEHPEPSGEEVWATDLIKHECERLGLELLPVNTPTGCAARLRSNGGSAVALRADIDAVTLEFPLRRPFGKASHTCGHDHHTAALLMAAELLAANRSRLNNDVYFIFQPAEETLQGAANMLNGGLRNAFDKPLTGVFGLHNRPELKAGDIVAAPGVRMAAKLDFELTILGVGGHGGEPQLCRDPIVAAAQLINAAQTIVSRSTAPQDACVVSFCSVNGGSQKNFAPTSVELTGSIRALSAQVQAEAYQRLTELAESIAAVNGCTARIQRAAQVPASGIDVRLAKKAMSAAQSVIAELGRGGIVAAPPAMGADDFALYSELAPTCYYWVGSAPEGEEARPWHDRQFKADPGFLPAAALLYAYSALQEEPEMR